MLHSNDLPWLGGRGVDWSLCLITIDFLVLLLSAQPLQRNRVNHLDMTKIDPYHRIISSSCCLLSDVDVTIPFWKLYVTCTCAVTRAHSSVSVSCVAKVHFNEKRRLPTMTWALINRLPWKKFNQSFTYSNIHMLSSIRWWRILLSMMWDGERLRVS